MAGALRKVLYFLGILEDSDIEWIVRTGSRQSVNAGAVVIEVATEPTFIQADLRLEGRAGEVLPALAERALSPR